MATYKQVSYGSQGSDVTELQKLLNNNGYSLDVDGIFGDNTQAAVKDYQQKNNLDVDGIVGLPDVKRADRDNCVDIYLSDEPEEVLADGVWQNFFSVKPEVLTKEEKRAYLDTITGVSLASDAFFPFGDNIERAKRSGVSYVAEPGGSVRDDQVIETCDKFGMTMAFTGMRLFHH